MHQPGHLFSRPKDTVGLALAQNAVCMAAVKKEEFVFQTQQVPRAVTKLFAHRETWSTTKESLLTVLPMDFVDDVPLDYMHLVCLGVRKLICLWAGDRPKATKERSKEALAPSKCDALSEQALGRFIPRVCEEASKPR